MDAKQVKNGEANFAEYGCACGREMKQRFAKSSFTVLIFRQVSQY